MAELTQDEADRCPYCGQFLRDPPLCCVRMEMEHAAMRAAEWKAREDYDTPAFEGW